MHLFYFFIFLKKTIMSEEIAAKLSSIVVWTLSSGIKIVLIAAVAYILKIISKRFTQRIVKSAVASERLNNSEAEIKRMQTLSRVFSWTINVIIFVIAAMMIIQELGVKIGPILTGAGIVGVAIGFGAQYLVRDVITGFFIIFENQYRIGDVITVENLSGTVEDISLRITTLRDADGTVHYIPHGEIKKVSNLTRKFSKINLNIGISYDADLDKVSQVVDRVGNELAGDPDWKDSIDEAPHYLRVVSFEDSSVKINITGITKPGKQWAVTGELLKRIKSAFDKESIELPYPQKVVHIAGAHDEK